MMGQIDDIRNAGIRAYRQELIAKGISSPNCGPGSDIATRFDAVAEMLAYVLAPAQEALDESDLSTCSDESVLRFAETYGIVPRSPTYASGKVLVNTTYSITLVVPAGQKMVYPSTGLSYTCTAGTYSAWNHIPIVCDESGSQGNLDAGEELQFSPAISGAPSFLPVDGAGVSGGYDSETIESLRQRCLDKLRNTVVGANPQHLIEVAEESDASIQKAFAYPALLGPGSGLVCLMGYWNKDSNWTRVASAETISNAALAIANVTPGETSVNVLSVREENCDLSFRIALPEPPSSGGLGGGWIDSIPFPNPTTIGALCTVSAITTTSSITVGGSYVSVAPIAGNHIAIWDNVNKEWQRAIVLSVSTAGTDHWIILDRPLNNVAVGQYVSPDAVGLDSYGAAMIASFQTMGPAEATSDGYRLPRSKRFPAKEREYYHKLGTRTMKGVMNYPEVSDFALDYVAPSEAPIPTPVGTAPYVLVMRHLAFYPAF